VPDQEKENSKNKGANRHVDGNPPSTGAWKGFPMRALFWTMLKDYLRIHKIDVVCLQETIKHDFMDQELRSLEVGEKFFWCWLPANGHSGGILLGFRDIMFDVGAVDMGNFFISTTILCKADRTKLMIMGLYGLEIMRFPTSSLPKFPRR
jgi:hypothetical protein